MIRDYENPPRPAAAKAALAFGKREDGSLTIFGLMVFMLMMVGGGIALDIMRSELKRTELQYAVDRAALASAGLDQNRDAEAIVKDYIRAAGIDEESVEVTSTVQSDARTVEVTGSADVNSLFMDLLGVETLLQPVRSVALERRTELELSLVVDISGSMGGAKIETLRTAASDFVAELLRGRTDLTSISLVPYNDRVNAGSLVGGVFDLTEEHPFSNCVVFSDAEYRRLDQPNGFPLQRMGHFDFRTSYRSGNSPGLVENPNCRTDEYGAILPWSNNVTELQNRISALQAGSWTAMDLGVKWGSLLLDPSSRDELATLSIDPDVSDAERVNANFVGRPVDYNTDGTHKVLVVMTDGVNTQQWDLKPSRKTGASGIYVYREPLSVVCENYRANATVYSNGSRSDGIWPEDVALCEGWVDAGRPDPADNTPFNLSVLGQTISLNLFGLNGSGCGTVGDLNEALCQAYYDDDQDNTYAVRFSVYDPAENEYWIDHQNRYRTSVYGGTAARRLDWAEVFGSLTMSYIANDIMSGMTFNTRVDYFYSWETTHGQREADTNLSNICKQIRDQGVVIYTIAFQAPSDGKAAMRDCAGDGDVSMGDNFRARYFEVENLDIESAFDDVLASVSRLRLDQ